MSSCECYDCNIRIRRLEAALEDLQLALQQLHDMLEREVDDRRAAVRMVQEGI